MEEEERTGQRPFSGYGHKVASAKERGRNANSRAFLAWPHRKKCLSRAIKIRREALGKKEEIA